MKFSGLLLAIGAVAAFCYVRDAEGSVARLIKRQLLIPFPFPLPPFLPIPDFLNLGVCHKTFLASSLLSMPDLAAGSMQSAPQYLESIKKVMDKVPYRATSVSDDNMKSMSQLYRFGMFCGLSYCDGQEEMQNIAKVSTGKNGTLYMGRFKMQTVRDVSENRYIIATDDDTKQIIVVWRGTINLGNVITDMDGTPIRDLPGETFPLKNAKSEKPGNTEFFQGFVTSVSREILRNLDADVAKAVKANADYQLIFAGHSLGGAQTVLAALHWHLTQQQPKITAIYTFGMPILGNNEANGWVAKELQPYNWVRAVSRGDLVPWGRVKESAQFSGDLEEVFLPESKEAITSPVTCKGQMDTKCSAGIPCEQKQWVDHVWVAGININPIQFCVLGRDPSVQQSSSNNSSQSSPNSSNAQQSPNSPSARQSPSNSSDSP